MEIFTLLLIAFVRFFTLLLALRNTFEFIACMPDLYFFRKYAAEKKVMTDFKDKMTWHASAASFGWALFVIMLLYRGQ